ncbi:MAG: hypothetical protein U0P81_02760 [Holophagaceae bacterium]
MRRPASLALAFAACLFLGCDLIIPGDGKDFGNSETYISRSGDKEIHFTLREKDFAAAPSWDPSQPLPLPLSKVQEIGWAELKKYRKDAEAWRMTELGLTRLHLGAGTRHLWIYRVAFDHPGTEDNIKIPITFQGQPMPGVIKPLDQTRYR